MARVNESQADKSCFSFLVRGDLEDPWNEKRRTRNEKRLSLLVAERYYWVEARGFVGWPDSEEETDRYRHHHS
jgi:hypothetical protein